MCLCHAAHHHCHEHPLPRRREALRLLGAAALAPLVVGCDQIAGLPGRLVPDETVRQLGVESWQRIRAQTPVSGNADYQQALEQVGQRLLAAAGENLSGWEMLVFAGEEVNAFALPGGKIGVYEGMFRTAANLDQLAAVVGHEIGHNTAEHAKERLAASVAQQVGLRLVSVALQLGDVQYANEIAALLGIGVEFGLVRPYSRGQELEADRLGLFTMAEAGFDPREAPRLWQRMEQAGGNRVPAFLSTHPDPEARIAAMEQILPEVLGAGQTAR